VHTYCTEPCLHFFQQQAQELLDTQTALQSLQQQQPDVTHPLQQDNQFEANPKQQHADILVPLFSPEQLQSVLDAVQVVRFGQRVLLPGCFGVTAEARPSGSGIGSCLWLMACGDQRCVCRCRVDCWMRRGKAQQGAGAAGARTGSMSRCLGCAVPLCCVVCCVCLCRYTYLAAASLAPGPSAHLHTPSLHNLDVLLLAPGCIGPQHQHQPQQQQQQQLHPPAPDDILGDAGLAAAVNAAAAAVSRGGRVLVPVFPGEGKGRSALQGVAAAAAHTLSLVTPERLHPTECHGDCVVPWPCCSS
jgi:hypothetical protein